MMVKMVQGKTASDLEDAINKQLNDGWTLIETSFMTTVVSGGFHYLVAAVKKNNKRSENDAFDEFINRS